MSLYMQLQAAGRPQQQQGGGGESNKALISDFDAGTWSIGLSDGVDLASTTASDVDIKIATGHGTQNLFIDSNYGISGSSLRTDVSAYATDGMWKVLNQYNAGRTPLTQTDPTHNRMVQYLTIPYAPNFGGTQHTYHFGTYIKGPNQNSSDLGSHYYHYFELVGSRDGHWVKVYLNKHPQHLVSNSTAVPDNPTEQTGWIASDPAWDQPCDYFDGMVRQYIQMRYGIMESQGVGSFTPYSVWIDDAYYYTENRTENEETICGIVITYHGSGEFDIDWMGFSQYDLHNERYEIKYSSSEIDTEADYTNATLLPGYPAGGYGAGNVGRTDNYFRANFTISGFNESNEIYFAMKDIYTTAEPDMRRFSYKVYPHPPTQDRP